MINKWKDKWFYYKLIAAIAILSGLLVEYLYHMISKTWIRDLDYPFSYGLFQDQFISYFTYQSNFIIGVWFLIAAIYHYKKNQIVDNQNLIFALTCYITVTCITYVFILFPGILLANKQVKVQTVIRGCFFHIVTPGLMIFYALKHKISLPPFKKYYRSSFFLYLIYPAIYTLFLLIRMIIYFNVPSLSDAPFVLVFPYGLNLENGANLIQWFDNIILITYAFLMFCLVIPFFFIIVNFFYFFILKKINNNKAIKTKR